MSSSSFKPGGSGTGASLPFVSIDIPADVTRAAASPNSASISSRNAGATAADSGRHVAAPFVSIDIPDVTGAPNAGPQAGGSGSDTPLPFVSIDIPADAG